MPVPPRSLLVALALAAGCAGPGPAPDVPADFALVLGEGGGVTGAVSGVRLGARGDVARWARAPDGTERVEPRGRLEAPAVEAAWARARSDALPAEADAPGNVTRTLTVVADGRTHRLAWAPGARPGLDALYADLLALLDTAR